MDSTCNPSDPTPPGRQGSPQLRVDSPGELRLVSNPGRPKAGRKPPGPGVLWVSFLTRGSPVPRHHLMHRSRASPASGRANSTQSGHPGDTGAVGGEWPGPCSTGHLGSRWKVAGQSLSAGKIPPKDIHRGTCGILPPAPGMHRSSGAHRPVKSHQNTDTGEFVAILPPDPGVHRSSGAHRPVKSHQNTDTGEFVAFCYRPPVCTGQPVCIGLKISERPVLPGGSGGSGGSTGYTKIFLPKVQFFKGCQFWPTLASSDSPAFGYY